MRKLACAFFSGSLLPHGVWTFRRYCAAPAALIFEPNLFPGLTAGPTFCRPFRPEIWAFSKYWMGAYLTRAEGPADNCHARQGVVRLWIKMRAERPGTAKCASLYFRADRSH